MAEGKQRFWRSVEKYHRDGSPCGTELAVFHFFCPQPNSTIPFLPDFDPSSQFGYIGENPSMFRCQFRDLSSLVSSDSPMPLLWSSLQSDTSSSFDSQPGGPLSLVTSELKQPPWGTQLLWPLQKHELQPQIYQAVNHLPFHPVLETGLQMEMELPSNQSHDDIMNASPWANQQIELRQIVGMNSLSPFQSDAAQNQTVIISEPVPISHSNCGTMVINGSQGENTCCSIDGALSNHLTRKRIGAFEEDITEPFDGSTLSLACLPSVCSSALSLQTMPIQPVSEIHLAKRQKKNEIAESEASATPPKALAFYNFMELRHNDYVAERDAIANQCNRSWEVCDIIDLDLKL